MTTVGQAVDAYMAGNRDLVATKLGRGKLEPRWYTDASFNTTLVTELREYLSWSEHLQLEVAYSINVYHCSHKHHEAHDLLRGWVSGYEAPQLPLRFYITAVKLGVIPLTHFTCWFTHGRYEQLFDLAATIPKMAELNPYVTPKEPIPHQTVLRLHRTFPHMRFGMSALLLESAVESPTILDKIFSWREAKLEWPRQVITARRLVVLAIAVADGYFAISSCQHEWPRGWTAISNEERFLAQLRQMRAIAFLKIVGVLPSELQEVIMGIMLPRLEGVLMKSIQWGLPSRRLVITGSDIEWLES